MTLAEGQSCKSSVEWMIIQFGVTATIYRPTDATGAFYSNVETSRATISSDTKIEMQEVGPKDLLDENVSAKAHIFASTDVAVKDIIKINNTGRKYRVTKHKPHNLFGTITHIELHLEDIKNESENP